MAENRSKHSGGIPIENIRDYFKRHSAQRVAINALVRVAYKLDPASSNRDAYMGMLKGRL